VRVWFRPIAENCQSIDRDSFREVARKTPAHTRIYPRRIDPAGLINYAVSKRFRQNREDVMGGFGSGRRRDGSRDTVEDRRSIDVNRLCREGCLVPGWQGGWNWSRDGETVASIGIRADVGRLHLSYRWKSRSGGEWETVDEPVALIKVPCRFGGERFYFHCPGVVNGIACRRRVVTLYMGGRWFLCRHCLRLPHASRSESAHDRALRRTQIIRRRLGGDASLLSPFPPKPKGMWRRTYERLHAQVEEVEAIVEAGLAAQFLRLKPRIRRERGKGDFWT